MMRSLFRVIALHLTYWCDASLSPLYHLPLRLPFHRYLLRLLLFFRSSLLFLYSSETLRYDPEDKVTTYSTIAGMLIMALSLVLFTADDPGDAVLANATAGQAIARAIANVTAGK